MFLFLMQNESKRVAHLILNTGPSPVFFLIKEYNLLRLMVLIDFYLKIPYLNLARTLFTSESGFPHAESFPTSFPQ
jgi:hypothetical protein